jgi:hypothetical protein
MAILLEGVSLVFENKVLERKYPGGVLGFRAAWDNGSYCSDSTVSRIAYFETRDAYCSLAALQDHGLEVPSHFAADVAVFGHGGTPWVPCIWLQVDRDPDDLQICWHVTEEQGKLAVPRYFRRDVSLAGYGILGESTIGKRLARVGGKNGMSIYRDRESGVVMYGPRPLCRH